MQSLPVAGLALGALVLLQACSSRETAAAVPAPDAAPVAVHVAQPAGSFNGRAVTGSGQVEAVETAHISTRVMGYITHMYAEVGDRVRQGQVLATISAQDIEAKRAQAQAAVAEADAALASARKDWERYTALYGQQSASARELDHVTLHYQSMKSKAEAARQMRNEVNAMLAYTRLTAPFSGVVTRKNTSAGDMANPGQPLYVVEQDGSYLVRAGIPESGISKVKRGAEALVDIKSTGRKIRGRVAEINPSSRFTGGQYEVKITIPGGEAAGLYSGMYAHVSIPVTGGAVTAAEGGTVLVPAESIITRDGLSGLYTVSSHGTALLRWVRLGRRYGDQVEVLSGLGKEESFIVTARGRLYNGAPLTIQQ